MTRRDHPRHPRHGEPADDTRPAEAGPASEEADAGDAPEAQAPPPGAEGDEQDRRHQELLERLQRLAADFSNYQKRMERRVRDERQEAVRDLVRDLLPVIDNFERALASAEEKHDAEALYAGVRLVHDQLIEALRKHGIEPIEAAGRRFDPEHHEAVAHLPSEDHPSGHVIEEVQRGYRHGGRTLRASRVAVSRGRAGAQDNEGETAEDAGVEADGQDALREGD
jgi:molecular chaperone GrpE